MSNSDNDRQDFVRKALKKGKISYDEILEAFPDSEQDIGLLDELMDELLNAGIDVVAQIEITDEDEKEDPSNNGSPNIYITNITLEILQLLRIKPETIYELTPEKFELLICDRLVAMGYSIDRVTNNANAKDGGIDIIAWLSHLPFAGLIAVQVKHHRLAKRKTGAKYVRELEGVVNPNISLQSGLIVTNTAFTPDAEWTAQKSNKIMALRGWNDLLKWIHDDFSGEYLFRELPEEIEIGNGIVIPRHKFNANLNRK